MDKQPLQLFLIICACILKCQSILDPARIEKIINNNTFYPPLNESGGLRPLVFGLIMSFGGNIDSSGAVPGVRVALDRINSDSSLLPGYSLHYALSDSQCHKQQAIEAFFKQVQYSEVERIALMGGGCSVDSEAIAEISHHFNFMQVSCTASTPVLSNRNRFPYYFQFLPSFDEYSPAHFAIIREFNWRHVVIIVQDESLFTITLERLKDLLQKGGITHTTDLFYSSQGLASLDRQPFSDSNERIYIIASYAPYARELLCEAYHRNIRYPTHLLLTYQWYSPNWWLVEDQNYTCTGEQRAEVLHMTLSVDIFNSSYLDNEGYYTSMNISEEEFYMEINKHLNEPPFNFTFMGSAFPCHDATWALAWSLNKTLNEVGLEMDPNEMSQTLFYLSGNFTKTMIKHMNESFIGLTGDISFDNNGIRKPSGILVYQYRQDTHGNLYTSQIMQMVHYYFQYTPNESRETVWPDDLIPYDGVANVVVDTVHISQTTIGLLLTAVGIMFVVACLVFNIAFRDQRIVQISRPRLNYLIILGGLLLYISQALYIIPTKDEFGYHALGSVWAWTSSIGSSFCYGTIIMKMFRVYYVVHNPRPKKTIRDRVMALGVLVLVSIDLVLLILSSSINNLLGYDVVLVPNRDRPRSVSGETMIVTHHMIYRITSSVANIVVLYLLFFYKMLLSLVVMALALCTRDVKVKGLEGAKCIIAGVYFITVYQIVGLLIMYTLRDNLYVYTTSFFLLSFIATTVILGLVFVPKMVALYKDPKGENIYGTPSFNSLQQRTQQTGCNTDTDTIDALKKRIQELENMEATKKSE